MSHEVRDTGVLAVQGLGRGEERGLHPDRQAGAIRELWAAVGLNLLINNM